jgi:hypothetical protein
MLKGWGGNAPKILTQSRIGIHTNVNPTFASDLESLHRWVCHLTLWREPDDAVVIEQVKQKGLYVSQSLWPPQIQEKHSNLLRLQFQALGAAGNSLIGLLRTCGLALLCLRCQYRHFPLFPALTFLFLRPVF